MDELPLRCLLIARQGPEDREERIQDHLLELAELARSCGFAVQSRRILKRSEIASKTFYGSGQLEALAAEVSRQGVTHLICDDELRGSQVNAIEKLTGLICLDRTGLILSIFEQRAQTREAKAQVELARCEYELPRLKGAWTHLERQGGGVGLRGGPGETQIEVDRRMVRTRISQLKRELAHLEQVRKTQREGRPKGLPRVALVGYTNAGKTSLLKALTGEGEPRDLLFATLDTTTRKAWLGQDFNPETGEGSLEPKHCLVADTVGFIRKLPHQLVAAFRSTLGEVRTADALLVVADAAHPDLEDHLKVVGATLREIGCEPEGIEAQPRLLVLNQVDRLHRPQKLALRKQHPGAVQACAIEDLGLDEIRLWLRGLIPGPAKPRELEAWELPESIPAQ
ncbi:MAG: GTPase HflX [Geothrix sp.]|jgi:GTP-binding protein HflX|uniref:GTPase HflX n=1 Tax=Candidatus Geothrix odensensis TaxID=2954440 RepID=A0A936F311_9BACT|nr:GTPase HflX [Candidatus Geothrix odensensis]MBP7619094.1 GTPase HflX [Geothrix sp.]MCC6513978.1 GTPase HflX [Geothrix sp.]